MIEVYYCKPVNGLALLYIIGRDYSWSIDSSTRESLAGINIKTNERYIKIFEMNDD